MHHAAPHLRWMCLSAGVQTLGILLVLATLGCSANDAGTYAKPPAAIPKPQSRTIAHEILAIEAPVAGEDPACVAMLESLISEARRRISGLDADANPIPTVNVVGENSQRLYAMKVFRTIDDLLIERHFVYPLTHVDTLTAGLRLTVLTAEEVTELKKATDNARRGSAIDANKERRFHLVDCDTACFIYLAIAEDLHLPISMVAAPTHVFVRWDYPARLGVPSGHVDFETNLGVECDDWIYAKRFGIDRTSQMRNVYLQPLLREEVLGYSFGVRGEIRARRGDYGPALQDLRKANAMYWHWPELKNLLAWLLATCPQAQFRNGDEAVQVAQSLLQLDVRANWLDTLASAYAETGDFDRAVRYETLARDMAQSPQASEKDVGLDYNGLIAAYHQHLTYDIYAKGLPRGGSEAHKLIEIKR